MAYKEVTRQSWSGRILLSLRGVIFGLLLSGLAFYLLFWNEGRAVGTARALEEGAGLVVSISPDRINPDYEGKLVHTSGLATTSEILNDEPFGIAVNAIHLKREVEMYQWREESDTRVEKNLGGSTDTTTTYSYSKGWSDRVIDSADFKQSEGHQNPSAMPYGPREISAREVRVGSFRLPLGLISSIRGFEPLPASLEGLSAELRWKSQPYDNGFYIGRSPGSPEIGDLKVQFRFVRPTTVSIVARQVGDTFEAYRASNGKTIQLLRTGTVSPEALFESAQKSNTITTWLLRILGLILMAFGIKTILAPFVVMADVIPALGNVAAAGTRLISFGLALFLSLLTMAIAWVFYRPLLAWTLVVLAVAAGIGVWRLLRKAGRSRAEPPPVPSSPPPQ